MGYAANARPDDVEADTRSDTNGSPSICGGTSPLATVLNEMLGITIPIRPPITVITNSAAMIRTAVSGRSRSRGVFKTYRNSRPAAMYIEPRYPAANPWRPLVSSAAENAHHNRNSRYSPNPRGTSNRLRRMIAAASGRRQNDSTSPLTPRTPHTGTSRPPRRTHHTGTSGNRTISGHAAAGPCLRSGRGATPEAATALEVATIE